MHRIEKALSAPLRFIGRVAMAGKYYSALGYSWHLAWVKAAR